MPTNRTPLNRPARLRISSDAITAFQRMQTVDHDKTDHEWWEAHSELCRALKLPPWEWPCILIPDEPCPHPPGCHAEQSWHDRRAQRPQALKLFAELTEAAREG